MSDIRPTDASGPSNSQQLAKVAAAFDPDRLRLARDLRALTQTEIAAQSNDAFTPAAVSQWENGHNRPSTEALAILATVLEVPVQFFERASRPVASTGAWFRSRRSTTVGARRQAAARIALVREFVRTIEYRVDLPPYALPRVDLPVPIEKTSTAKEQHVYRRFIETAAEDLRTGLGLPRGPIDNVVRVLERHGVVVVRLTKVDDRIDAFSMPFEGRPIVALGDDKGDAVRSRLDACHEAVHLAGHGTPTEGSKALEAQAMDLGAAILTPRADIEPELSSQRLDVARLVELKLRWGVSIAALLRRALVLGVLTADRYQQWMKYSSIKGWRKPNGEPGSYRQVEQPVLLARAAELATDGDTVELQRLAATTGLPSGDLADLVRRRPAVDLR